LEGGLNTTSVFLVFLSTLNAKALRYYIVGVLLLSTGIGVDFIFKGIVDRSKIKPAILLRGLVRI
jgi:hypothetical protein